MAREEDQEIEAPVQLPSESTLTLSEEDAIPDEPEEKTPKETPRDKSGKWTRAKEARKNVIAENEEFRQTTKTLGEQIKAMGEQSARQIAELVAALRPQAQPQTPQVPPEVASLEEQITQVGKLMKAELAKIAAGGEEDEYYKLDRKRLALIARAEGAAAGWGKQPQAQGPQITPEQAARHVQIMREFPQFDSHPKWSIVAGKLRSAYLDAGSPDNYDTDRMAVAEAARQLGIQTRAPAASQRTRQAYGAPPSAGRAPAAGPRRMQIPRNLVAGSGLTEQQIAEALFEDE